MWIEKTKGGSYRYCERCTDKTTGKQKKISVTLKRKNKKKAVEMLLEKSMELENVKKTFTLSDLVGAYLEDQKKSVRDSTYRRNKWACSSLLKIMPGDMLLTAITAGFVRSSFYDTGESVKTLNERLTRFKAMIRWGYRNGFIDDVSFLDKIERFRDVDHVETPEDIRCKYLTGKELDAVICSMDNDIWRNLTAFLSLSGLRIGEALALMISDINMARRIIRVRKTLDLRTYAITPPKTACSVRDVYIQDELIKTVRNAIRDAKANGCTSLFYDPKDHGPAHYDAYRQYLSDHVKAVTGRNLTPHGLRHTHASLLMESGVPMEVIQRRLGHEKSDVTRKIYAHVTDELQRADNATIKAVKLL